MYLTVGICTWNRAHLLEQTLTAMHELEIPSDIHWELLVVNNNSTDDTDNVIEKHKSHLPIRRIFEPQAGKSFALNHAIREARGEYILWTDDDVLVDPNWMAAYSAAFIHWSNASIFGGPIKPWLPGTPPNWLAQVLPDVGGAYGVRDYGDKSIALTRKIVPYGANMAVRAKEQKQHLYDIKLGPRPNSSLRAEDTALARKMLAEGSEGRYVHGAAVRHYIPETHQTIKYLSDYYKGLGEYYALQTQNRKGLKLFGRPLGLWKHAFQTQAKYRIRRVLCAPEVWIKDLIQSNIVLGRFRVTKNLQSNDHKKLS